MSVIALPFVGTQVGRLQLAAPAAVARLWRWALSHFGPERAQAAFGDPAALFTRTDVLVCAVLMLAGGLLHATNMFNAPYLENDEGTYISQAWAVYRGFGLTPYTYWYDHPPLGWILIAGWIAAFAWLQDYGATIIDIGRLFMLAVQLVCMPLVFALAKRFSGSTWAAALAVVIYAAPPLVIEYHRRILLDNVMVMFALMSFALIVLQRKRSLTSVALSGALLGCALLSKHSVALVFVPAALAALWIVLDRRHLLLGMMVWFLCFSSVFGIWILFALLRGEFFPPGFLPWDTQPHTSLIGTLMFHLGRDGAEGTMFSFNNDFWRKVRFLYWAEEPYVAVLGAISLFGCLFAAWKRPILLVPALAGLGMLAFLARGKLVINYYFLPLMPWLAICCAIMLWFFVRWARQTFDRNLPSELKFVGVAVPATMLASLLFLAVSVYPGRSSPVSLFTDDMVTSQLQALDWVRDNIPPEAKIITDEYALIDMWRAGHSRAHYYWKADNDPAVSGPVFGREWKNVDFILVTPQVILDIQEQGLVLTGAAYKRSTPTDFRTTKPTIRLIEIRRVDSMDLDSVTVSHIASGATGLPEAHISMRLSAVKEGFQNLKIMMELRDADGNVLAKDFASGVTAESKDVATLEFVVPWPEMHESGFRIAVAVFDENWAKLQIWREFDGALKPLDAKS